MSIAMLLTLSLLVAQQSSPMELAHYLAKPDPAYAVSTDHKDAAKWELKMTSGKWQGEAWRHDLVIVWPKAPAKSDVAILNVTGDRVDRADMPFAQELADASGLPVATVFNVPNQPIFDLKEDDLIAYSFGKFLETGDDSWPLLFPMVRASIRAMDSVVKATAKEKQSIKRFLVTGESKRGWTTWLTAAAKDKRVIGIAPVMFDMLNFAAQLPHQLEVWGKYSEMLQSYTDPGLQSQMATDRGKELARLMDPYCYLTDINVPVLIVNGSSDRFWAVDALSLYVDAIKGPKSVLILPNEGHGFGNKTAYIQTVAEFAKNLAGIGRWPRLTWQFETSAITLRTEGEWNYKATLWVAESETLDFRMAHWIPQTMSSAAFNLAHTGMETRLSRDMTHKRLIPGTNKKVDIPMNQAAFGMIEYRIKDGELITLTTPVKVYPIKH